MKERPILFSIPMVTAILEGRKTQTRRVLKKQPILLVQFINYESPYGIVGDRLWVRERFNYGFLGTGSAAGNSFVHFYDGGQKYQDGAYYDAKNHPRWDPKKLRWKPSIHMPRWASRITLEITGVRVAPLLDISEADAHAEGAPLTGMTITGEDNGSYVYAFEQLWKHINGEESWTANPFVWVIEFKRVMP